MSRGLRIKPRYIPFEDAAARAIAKEIGGTVSGYSQALDIIKALDLAGFHIVPHGDGVGLTSITHPPGPDKQDS